MCQYVLARKVTIYLTVHSLVSQAFIVLTETDISSSVVGISQNSHFLPLDLLILSHRYNIAVFIFDLSLKRDN